MKNMKLAFFKKAQIEEFQLPEKGFDFKTSDLKSMSTDQLTDLVKKLEKHN